MLLYPYTNSLLTMSYHETTKLFLILLPQEFESGTEVLLSIPSVVHHPVDLVGQRSQWSCSLCSGGSILSQSQVLGHQGSAETSFIVIAGGNIFKNTRAWIVGVNRPAAPSCRSKNTS